MRATRPALKVEVWFQDEARIGQQGTLTRVWARRGSRPRAVRQTEYEWVYLYAAVCPQSGESSALVAPSVNTGLMNGHLRQLGDQLGPDRHAVLVLDNAGWHTARALEVPGNLTLLHLPPYAPELNPVERVWDRLRSRYLSNRVYRDYDHLFDATGEAWNRITEEDLRSICHTPWCERAD